MTTEELLALPENNEVERWLFGGRLIERPVTRRSFSHSRTLVRICQLLRNWLELVWRVEPVLGLVTVFRPDAEPEAFNIHGHLSGDPHLPGFRVAVAEIFT